jgi:hypothetical protein
MSYTVTPTDMPIYFVIEKAKPIKLLMENAWSEYDQAKSAADRVDGVVTNASQLKKAGYEIDAYERSAKPRAQLYRVFVNLKKFKIGEQ